MFSPALSGAMTLLSAFWGGLVVGVSFIATPAKFSAPSLTLPAALEVGRATFHLTARIEWILATALLLIAVFASRSFWRILAAAVVTGLVLVQSLWLLPALDARIDMVIAGTPTRPSSLHVIYILAECVKLLLLVALSAAAFRPGLRRIGK